MYRETRGNLRLWRDVRRINRFISVIWLVCSLAEAGKILSLKKKPPLEVGECHLCINIQSSINIASELQFQIMAKSKCDKLQNLSPSEKAPLKVAFPNKSAIILMSEAGRKLHQIKDITKEFFTPPTNLRCTLQNTQNFTLSLEFSGKICCSGVMASSQIYFLKSISPITIIHS